MEFSQSDRDLLSERAEQRLLSMPARALGPVDLERAVTYVDLTKAPPHDREVLAAIDPADGTARAVDPATIVSPFWIDTFSPDYGSGLGAARKGTGHFTLLATDVPYTQFNFWDFPAVGTRTVRCTYFNANPSPVQFDFAFFAVASPPTTITIRVDGRAIPVVVRGTMSVTVVVVPTARFVDLRVEATGNGHVGADLRSITASVPFIVDPGPAHPE